MRIFARVFVLALAMLSLTACDKLKKEGASSKDASVIHLLCTGPARLVVSSDETFRLFFNKTVPIEVSLTLDEERGEVLALTESALSVRAFATDMYGELPESVLTGGYFQGVGRCSLQGTEIERVVKVTHSKFTIQTLCPSGAVEPDIFPLDWIQTYVINRLDGSFKFGGGYGVDDGIQNLIHAQGKCVVPTERRF
jgi:hypothetical protein